MIDPENVAGPTKDELEEAAVDETPDTARPEPIEADPGDVAEQRTDVGVDEDERVDEDDAF